MKIKNSKIIIQIICMLTAIILWALVMIDKNPLNNKTFNRIPVLIVNLSTASNDGSNIIIDDLSNLTVNVTVRGLNDALTNLQPKDIKVIGKIGQLKEGSNQLLVDVELPKDMELISISPKSISYNVEGIVNIPIDITTKVEGSQATGYYLGEGVPNPDTVYVKGPRSVVNSVSSAVVVASLNENRTSITQNRPVVLYDNTGNEINSKLLTIVPNSVEVSHQILPTKKVPVVYSVIGEVMEGYRHLSTEMDVKLVEIAAPEDVIADISILKTEVFDISKERDSITVQRNIILPDGAKIIGNDNIANITVKIEKIVEKEIEFSFEDIYFLNNKNDFEISPIDEDKKIIITIKALESIINDIKKDDISLEVDMNNFIEGENSGLIVYSTNVDVEEIVCDTELIGVNAKLTNTDEND